MLSKINSYFMAEKEINGRDHYNGYYIRVTIAQGNISRLSYILSLLSTLFMELFLYNICIAANEITT